MFLNTQDMRLYAVRCLLRWLFARSVVTYSVAAAVVAACGVVYNCYPFTFYLYGCVLFSSRVRVEIGFSVWPISCYAHVSYL